MTIPSEPWTGQLNRLIVVRVSEIFGPAIQDLSNSIISPSRNAVSLVLFPSDRFFLKPDDIGNAPYFFGNEDYVPRAKQSQRSIQNQIDAEHKLISAT
jgi:hypothetical protein